MSQDIGVDVLSTTLNTKNGAISAQLGDSVVGEKTSDEAEWMQHVGFASRPAKAEPGKSACQVLSLERTDRDIVYASRDLRGTSVYGALGEGETAIFAGGPNNQGTSLVTLKDDGSEATITMGVKQGNSSGGSPVHIAVKSDGNITIKTGTTTITVNGQTGDVSIDATTIALGLGGSPVVVNNNPTGTPLTPSLAEWIATVSTGLTGLGIVNTPPPALLATKVTAS